jgi:hypothetical protein
MQLDGKVRAQPFANAATSAILWSCNGNKLFGIKFKAMLRAHAHADVAALAPLWFQFKFIGQHRAGNRRWSANCFVFWNRCGFDPFTALQKSFPVNFD